MIDTIRVKLLKDMNNYIINVIGDEEVTERWLMCGIPDGASYDDYEYIANDDEEFASVCYLFGNLVSGFKD